MVAHCLPWAAPPPSPAPWGCHPGQQAAGVGGRLVPKQLPLAGAAWAVGPQGAASGAGMPCARQGQGRPELQRRAVHPKSPPKRRAGGHRLRWEQHHEAWIFSSPRRCPGQTLVTLASQPKRPLRSREEDLGPWCEGTRWPPRCLSQCLCYGINLPRWRGSFPLRSRDPLGLPVGESGFQGAGHPFSSRPGLQRRRQHPRFPAFPITVLLFCASQTAWLYQTPPDML